MLLSLDQFWEVAVTKNRNSWPIAITRCLGNWKTLWRNWKDVWKTVWETFTIWLPWEAIQIYRYQYSIDQKEESMDFLFSRKSHGLVFSASWTSDCKWQRKKGKPELTWAGINFLSCQPISGRFKPEYLHYSSQSLSFL